MDTALMQTLDYLQASFPIKRDENIDPKFTVYTNNAEALLRNFPTAKLQRGTFWVGGRKGLYIYLYADGYTGSIPPTTLVNVELDNEYLAFVSFSISARLLLDASIITQSFGEEHTLISTPNVVRTEVAGSVGNSGLKAVANGYVQNTSSGTKLAILSELKLNISETLQGQNIGGWTKWFIFEVMIIPIAKVTSSVQTIIDKSS